jgi:hypothetical protein
MKTITLSIPMRLHSEANERSHWAAKARRVKKQREKVTDYLMANSVKPSPPPSSVKITRVGKKLLDPLINLPSSAKAVEDELCLWFGVKDDVNCPIEFDVQQAVGAYETRIEMTWEER